LLECRQRLAARRSDSGPAGESLGVCAIGRDCTDFVRILPTSARSADASQVLCIRHGRAASRAPRLACPG